MTTINKFAVLVVALALPLPIEAGGYGEAGVRDATVGQMPAETAAVWCPKLRAEVPIELQRQLDCEDGIAVGTAEPAVAPARFGRGLFGLPPHQPIGGSSALEDDGDRPVIPTTASPTPTTPTPATATPEVTDRDEPENTGSGAPKSKWDRLNELGITKENLQEQDEEIRDAIEDLVKNPPPNGDWNVFQP